ncbi:cullin-associated nedd8-dissociated protein [Cyclospora cayetanensis]|uniref:Cullin-associated nedd8-dissociated protein n=1 Tax=Cyclospora cayetanensis TaxID=88456 RepID=A0A1D3DB15_9EIME|nr:cullin-associated nedd8-dissociated protein [Cyclospora cayetanensis]
MVACVLGILMRCYGGCAALATTAAAAKGWSLFAQRLASTGFRKAGRLSTLAFLRTSGVEQAELRLKRHPDLLHQGQTQQRLVSIAAKLLAKAYPGTALAALHILLLLLQLPEEDARHPEQQASVKELVVQQCLSLVLTVVHLQPLEAQTVEALSALLRLLCFSSGQCCTPEDLTERLLSGITTADAEGSLGAVATVAARLRLQQDSEEAPQKILQVKLSPSPSSIATEALHGCVASLALKDSAAQQHIAAAISRIVAGFPATCLPELLSLLRQQRQLVLQAEGEERGLASSNEGYAGEKDADAPAEEALAQRHQEKQQQLAAAKSAKKQQRERELLLVTALHGGLLLQTAGPLQQQSQGRIWGALGDLVLQVVDVLRLLAASRSEAQRGLVADCLVQMLAGCPGKRGGSSSEGCCSTCTCDDPSNTCSGARACCQCCCSVYGALEDLLAGEVPEQRLTGVAAVRDCATHGVLLPLRLKASYLNCLSAQDLRVRRAAVSTVAAMCTSALGLAWNLAAEANTLMTHLLEAVEVREELITQVAMGPFKHTIDGGLRLPEGIAPLCMLVRAVTLGSEDPSNEAQHLAAELLLTLAEFADCWDPQQFALQ